MNKEPIVSIGLVAFDCGPIFELMVHSLFGIEYDRVEVLFRDQSSNGLPGERLRFLMEMIEVNPNWEVQILRGENLMHSGGHNELISRAKGEFYFCGSMDVIYEKACLKKLVNFLVKREEFAAVQPLIFRIDEDFLNDGVNEIGAETRRFFEFSKKIDSAGIGIGGLKGFYEIGDGKEIQEIAWDEMVKNGKIRRFVEESEESFIEVFGVCGAAMLFRKKMKDEVKDEFGVLFDNRIHYKNDVELAFRIKRTGKKVACLLTTKVAHARGLGSGHGWILKFVIERLKKKTWMKRNSYLGHVLVLKKHVFGKEKGLREKLFWRMNWALKSLVRFF